MVELIEHPRKPAPLPGRPGKHLGVQALALGLAAAVLVVVVWTTASNLAARGIPLGADFLLDRAGFTVSETLLPYTPDDSNLWAIVVGVGNTLFVSALVSLASTLLGTLLGVARISDNPLVSGLALLWIEGVRNTPPILLLIFLYTLWWQALPATGVLHPLPGVLASLRGVAIPALIFPWPPTTMLAALLAAGALVATAGGLAGRFGRDRRRWALTVAALLVLTLAVAAAAARRGFAVNLPQAAGADFRGGAVITPELFTILAGLTLYTTGFIAEIIRTGVNAVPRAQWEAARALGLSPPNVLRLVVLPQMLRVILPPMTSQYINVVKNSTLALVVGYTDFMTVMGTVINKTSHAIEGTLVIVGVYLTINLAMSATLNWYNGQLAVKER
ncbi:ABC transporter permease subunit [Phenylobacterium aquaticum]|uniref:ABC transporter permease subunit n=1 Tax=Phenylobacterium aquaticum TaxID=1763816 RepID=UPI001F5DD3AC|nr:ABC transporter permease subunit [Phenylobacterium aquaticum]